MASRAHRAKVNVPPSHEVVVQLPEDFPAGEADLVIVPSVVAPAPGDDAVGRLKAWIASLPPTAPVPLAAFDRGALDR